MSSSEYSNFLAYDSDASKFQHRNIMKLVESIYMADFERSLWWQASPTFSTFFFFPHLFHHCLQFNWHTLSSPHMRNTALYNLMHSSFHYFRDCGAGVVSRQDIFFQVKLALQEITIAVWSLEFGDWRLELKSEAV